MLLIGESFRRGGQNTRVRGTPESYKEQIDACVSHKKFLENLSFKHNVEVNVCLATYNTQYNQDLINIYEKYNPAVLILADVIGLNNLFHFSLSKIDINQYDAIFYCRIDLLLKDKFLEIFDPNYTTIRYPSVCYLYEGFNKMSNLGNHPRVSDTMCFIPKKYFYKLKYFYIGHESWCNLINEGGLTYDDIDTILDTYHDSDTEKDFNPIYKIVNRGECTKWYSEGHKFNKFDYGK